MPPNSPLFLDATPLDIASEYYAWYYDDQFRSGKFHSEDPDFEDEIADIDDGEWEDVK